MGRGVRQRRPQAGQPTRRRGPCGRCAGAPRPHGRQEPGDQGAKASRRLEVDQVADALEHLQARPAAPRGQPLRRSLDVGDIERADQDERRGAMLAEPLDRRRATAPPPGRVGCSQMCWLRAASRRSARHGRIAHRRRHVGMLRATARSAWRRRGPWRRRSARGGGGSGDERPPVDAGPGEHQPIDARRIGDGEVDRQPRAQREADQVGPLDLQVIEQGPQVLVPGVAGVAGPERP